MSNPIRVPKNAITHDSPSIPKITEGMTKISVVPIRSPIDHIPPLDFLGKYILVEFCSFNKIHEQIRKGSL